ncbi:MAG: PTS sugar transporter subunit IIA [Phycisphaerales bacterium]|nr:PTS sugar transporter subunit IIA [Phycisphaerales bacterium]
MKFAEFVVKEAIVPELQATDRDGVIRELVAALAEAKALPASEIDAVAKAIISREKNGSTGFGKGVAVPHAKHPALKKSVGAVGRSTVGVNFAALDQAPVYTIFLLLSPTNNADVHLQAMENIFRNLQQDTFRRFLRQSDSQQKILDLLDEADQAGASR